MKAIKGTSKIIGFYLVVCILIIGIFYMILPSILNYPPDSLNNEFQKEVDGLTYTQQFVIIVGITSLMTYSMLFVKLNSINKYIKKLKTEKEDGIKIALKIKQMCLQTPFVVFLIQTLTVGIILPLSMILKGTELIVALRISLAFIIFFLLGNSLSYILAKNEFKKILALMYKNNPNLIVIEKNTGTLNLHFKPLHNVMLLELLPLILVALIFTIMVSYSTNAKIVGDMYYDHYIVALQHKFKDKQYQNIEEIKQELNTLELLKEEDDVRFVLSSNGEYTTLNSEKDLNEFFVKYTIEKSQQQNGRTYDYYCIDVQGTVIPITTTNGDTYYVGIQYPTSSMQLLYVLIGSFIVLFVLITICLIYIIRMLVKDIKRVTDNLNEIAQGKNLNEKLPILTNDEIAQLSNAFNDIQEMTNEYIEEIHNNQEVLIESDRLASLGQLIGGIAHNLKTPIMSISGNLQGLQDLVTEYNLSIGDNEVNDEDHKEIAQEMQELIEKTKIHLSYMSDIITVVKGQAVQTTEMQIFSPLDVMGRIDILMKHNLKKALIELKVDIEEQAKTAYLKGDINGLVQVIDNIIQNAIYAYNGKPNEVIDMKISKQDNSVVFKISDYGCGMPKKVQEKLFKEMITTRGKNGTGLGLYMSYSMVKGNFKGDMYFETKENEGTTFYIKIPINE